MVSRETEQWLYDNEFDMVLFQIMRFLKFRGHTLYREIERESLHTHQTEGKQEGEKKP